MNEVEITLKVNESLEECKEKLEKQNFKIIRKSLVDDLYMTQNKKLLSDDNIDDILRSCVLMRYLKANNQEFKKLTYKNKICNNGNIISEKKINVDCSDLNKAIELFDALGFEKLVRVKYEVTVFSDGKREFAFQQVDGLGLLLEYESNKNMDNGSYEEILKEKQNMLEEILTAGLKVKMDLNIKKAHELILNKYFA